MLTPALSVAASTAYPIKPLLPVIMTSGEEDMMNYGLSCEMGTI